MPPYLFGDQIKEIGGFKTLGGDLEEVFIGGFVGGLCSANMDVPIWRGMYGVGPLALFWGQGSLGLSSLDRCCGSSVSWSCLVHPSHTLPFGVSPFSLLSGPLSQIPTTPQFNQFGSYVKACI